MLHLLGGVRVRSIFNILGPLVNPAKASHQLGCYERTCCATCKGSINLGVKRAMVVHGHDGLDEVSHVQGLPYVR